MREIKKINKNSLAKLLAVFHAVVGFFIGVLVAVVNIFNILSQNTFSESAFQVVIFNIGAGVIVGVLTFLLFGLVGWLIGFLIALIYNFIAKKFGGIKIDLD
jgi:hypothetical protein